MRVIVRYSTEKFTMRCLGMLMIVWFYRVYLLALCHVVLLILCIYLNFGVLSLIHIHRTSEDRYVIDFFFIFLKFACLFCFLFFVVVFCVVA